MRKNKTLKGVTLVETVVAMVILFGVLTLMLTGFSLAGNYLLKGLRMNSASDEAMYAIEMASADADKGKDVSGYPNISAVPGSVTISAGGSTETINGMYYTSSAQVQDISASKTMYYSVFRQDVSAPTTPANKLSVSSTNINLTEKSKEYVLNIRYYDTDSYVSIPKSEKGNVTINLLTKNSEKIADVKVKNDSVNSYISIHPKKAGEIKFTISYGGEETAEITVTVTK